MRNLHSAAVLKDWGVLLSFCSLFGSGILTCCPLLKVRNLPVDVSEMVEVDLAEQGSG